MYGIYRTVPVLRRRQSRTTGYECNVGTLFCFSLSLSTRYRGRGLDSSLSRQPPPSLQTRVGGGSCSFYVDNHTTSPPPLASNARRGGFSILRHDSPHPPSKRESAGVLVLSVSTTTPHHVTPPLAPNARRGGFSILHHDSPRPRSKCESAGPYSFLCRQPHQHTTPPSPQTRVGGGPCSFPCRQPHHVTAPSLARRGSLFIVCSM